MEQNLKKISFTIVKLHLAHSTHISVVTYPKLALPPSLKKGGHIAKTSKHLQILTREMKLLLSYLR